VGGGAKAIQEFLTAGLLDELQVHLVPILLGGGVRLFENLEPGIGFEKVKVTDSPEVTHIILRIGKA
jgi:riboflavin biosynthesis pyrimidine reductase